jgi:hypothetical protein
MYFIEASFDDSSSSYIRNYDQVVFFARYGGSNPEARLGL